jgi:hypothetical protein
MNIYQPFVYKWTEKSTGKWYIGSRTKKKCHPNDGYICSSKYVKPLIIANPINWSREILATGNNAKEILLLEADLLRSLDAKNEPMSYNMHNGDGKFTTAGMPGLSGENHPMYGKSLSEEHKQKLRDSMPDMTGENNPNYGKSPTGKTRQKISESLTGRTFSEKTLQKMSASQSGEKHYMYGKSHSEESNQKRSLALKGKTKPKVTCPHCGILSGAPVAARWHFDRCKASPVSRP